MNRRHVIFRCQGAALVGSLDPAPGSTGLLIVSGGNELRSGPWGSQAELAARIAASGFPVMRFDRRGVGDSEGANGGYTTSAPDIAAALRAFRAEVPTLTRVVAFGNCDAASALMLAKGQGIDALVLANPWTFEPEGELVEVGSDDTVTPATPMPPSMLRAHYLRRLTDPRAIWRLLTGKVKVGKLASSLADAARTDSGPGPLAVQMAEGIADFVGPVHLLVAARDRTGQAFLANWDRDDARRRVCPDATHSFVEPQARIWLQGQILGALRAFD